jgi:hypothetical protein
MAVTDFGRYLRCPYRWALQRLLRLESFDEGAVELDPLRFGSLAHDALCALGEEPDMAASTNAERVFRFLVDRLHVLARELHGERPLPAIAVQIARLEQRLRSFSEFQARSAAEGWRIRRCEVAFEGDVALDIPDQTDMPLRGRIDRIDENINTGDWRVIDYKTGERGDHPLKTHHDARELPVVNGALAWHDLQLPLYHLLVTHSTDLRLPADRIELGYVVLPRQADGARWLSAAWTREHLEHGMQHARSIVRDIRDAVRTGNFARKQGIDARWDEFARICQTTAFKSAADESDFGNGAGGEE